MGDSRCRINYHVEEVADLGSFCQVPHVNVAIVTGRQHDAGVKRVSLHHKHLIIVTLEQKRAQTLGEVSWSKTAVLFSRNASVSHSQIKHAAAVQWLCSTL